MPPKWRHYVNDEAQSSDAATFRQELPNRGALHAILLKCQITNGATSARNKDIFDAVDEIEVIADGSEILFSLKPTEFEKWIETLQGQELQIVEDMSASAVQEGVFPIMFGRGLYDAAYFLPLERFKDVNLEVTYSPSIAADEGFATGTMKFDIELLISFEPSEVNYQGTLVTRRIKSFTSAASGEEEAELPDNTVIRAIGVYAYEAGIADGTDITKVELEDKASGESLFEADWDDFIHISRELFGAEVTHRCKALLANDETWNCRIGEVLHYNVEIVETADATNDEFNGVFIDAIAGDLLTFDAWNIDVSAGSETVTAQTSDVTLFVSVTGKSPTYFGLIPFLYDDDPVKYLNTARYGKPSVILTQGAAGAEVNVSIQELRSY